MIGGVGGAGETPASTRLYPGRFAVGLAIHGVEPERPRGRITGRTVGPDAGAEITEDHADLIIGSQPVVILQQAQHRSIGFRECHLLVRAWQIVE